MVWLRLSRYRLFERIQGLAFDAILVTIAAMISEDYIQAWLLENTGALYHGLVLLHLVTCPAMLVAIVCGYGRSEEGMNPTGGASLLTWAAVLLFAGGFVVPGCLGLLFRVSEWEMLTTIFVPPVVIFPLWMGALVVAERKGYSAPAKMGETKPWWRVQALALLTWAYLIWLETMLLAGAARPSVLSRVCVPLGVLIDYLPIRVVLYYIRDSARWEIVTITLSVLHLLYRISVAG